MSTRLDRITNWHELAREVNGSPAGLAKQGRVTLRTLERHFLLVMGKTPRVWLKEERMVRARELLVDGSSVKETAGMVGYRNQHHFARDFKQHHGHCPCAYAAIASAHYDVAPEVTNCG